MSFRSIQKPIPSYECSLLLIQDINGDLVEIKKWKIQLQKILS
jgi:hypothetical protein